MRLGSWLWLVRRDVLSQKVRLAILVFCIALSAAICGLVFAAFLYLRSEVRPRLRELFPERRVILRPTAREMLFFQMEGPKITAEMADAVRAMPEVEQVHRVLSANFPVSANFEVETFKIGFTTDVILLGVDEALVGDAVTKGVRFAPAAAGASVPVIVSEYFVDAYNLGFAESSSLPKISPNKVRGIGFELLLGESTLDLVKTNLPSRFVPARIAGLTRNPALFGLTIPIEQLIEWNREFNPKKPVGFSMLQVDLVSPEGAAAVEAKAAELGIGYEAQGERLAHYLQLVATVELILGAALAVVLAIAGVGIFSTTGASVRERRPAWGLHRATGLGRHGVLVLAGGHALAAAIPAGIIACLMTVWASSALTATFGEYLESLTIIPSDPFAIGVPVFAAIMTASVLLAIIPALVFALPIIMARPVTLLSEKSL